MNLSNLIGLDSAVGIRGRYSGFSRYWSVMSCYAALLDEFEPPMPCQDNKERSGALNERGIFSSTHDFAGA